MVYAGLSIRLNWPHTKTLIALGLLYRNELTTTWWLWQKMSPLLPSPRVHPRIAWDWFWYVLIINTLDNRITSVHKECKVFCDQQKRQIRTASGILTLVDVGSTCGCFGVHCKVLASAPPSIPKQAMESRVVHAGSIRKAFSSHSMESHWAHVEHAYFFS